MEPLDISFEQEHPENTSETQSVGGTEKVGEPLIPWIKDAPYCVYKHFLN